ncbi:MAG: hypothetical protein EAX87_08420 [Candidatus Thorarchaeota archaeon]|nr:hypothetical protein [Candidatus Thorarchaeota archaeon]
MSRWTYAIATISLGFGILITSVLLWAFGFDVLALSLTNVLAPFTAISVGILGMAFFGRESFLKEDRYHTLYAWIALGLIFFSLADFTTILVSMAEDSTQLCFTIGLVQIPGLFLWALGIMSYLKSLNSSLRLTEGTQLWLALGIITTLMSLSLIVIVSIVFPMRNLLSTIVFVPITIVLGLVFFILLAVLWIFKDGSLAQPLLFLLFGISLLFFRAIFWQIEGYCNETAFNQLMAIESYLFIAVAFLIANKIGISLET